MVKDCFKSNRDPKGMYVYFNGTEQCCPVFVSKSTMYILSYTFYCSTIQKLSTKSLQLRIYLNIVICIYTVLILHTYVMNILKSEILNFTINYLVRITKIRVRLVQCFLKIFFILFSDIFTLLTFLKKHHFNWYLSKKNRVWLRFKI